MVYYFYYFDYYFIDFSLSFGVSMHRVQISKKNYKYKKFIVNHSKYISDHRQIIGSIFQMMRLESSGCFHSKTIGNLHKFDTFFERKFLKMIDFHTRSETSVKFFVQTPYLAEELNLVFFSLESRFYTLKLGVSKSMLRFTP